jgi:hypothetical protein
MLQSGGQLKNKFLHVRLTLQLTVGASWHRTLGGATDYNLYVKLGLTCAVIFVVSNPH